MKKTTLSRTLSLILSLVMIVSAMSLFAITAEDETPDVLTIDYSKVQRGCVDKKISATIENIELDGKSVVSIKPLVKDAENPTVLIDGFGFNQKLTVDIREYKFASVEYKYVSSRPVPDKMILRVLKSGGILKTSTAVTATGMLEAGEWKTAYFPLGGALAPQIDETGDGIIRQIHFYPFGNTAVSTMNANDVLYIGKLSF